MHEEIDVRVPAVLKFGAAFAVLVGAFLLIGHFWLGWIAGRRPPPAPDPVDPIAAYPSPRLQVQESTDMRRFREWEDSELNSARWIDRGAGVAKIPVDEAMNLFVRRNARGAQ